MFQLFFYGISCLAFGYTVCGDRGESCLTYVTVPRTIYVENVNTIRVRTTVPRPRVTINMLIKRLSRMESITTTMNTRHTTNGGWYELDVPYKVPFITDPTLPVQVTLNITVDSHRSSWRRSHLEPFRTTLDVTVRQRTLVILSDTDKPLYRPGEVVRARLLTLRPEVTLPYTSIEYPTKKVIRDSQGNLQLLDATADDILALSRIVYDQIYIEDSSGTRLKQWLNATAATAALVQYQLLADAPEGTWKLMASIRGQKVEISFEVKRYVLPRFLVTIQPPINLNSLSSTVQFKVCAAYTNGPPLPGSVRAQLCVCNKPNSANEKDAESVVVREGLCPKLAWLSERRPCVVVNDVALDSKTGCASFDVPATTLRLRNKSYPTWNQVAVVCAQVEEAGTGSTVSQCSFESKVDFQLPRLELKLPGVYKRDLPLRGSVQMIQPNRTDFSQVQIRLELTEQNNYCYGRFGSWNSDKTLTESYNHTIELLLNRDGRKEFIIPPIESTNSISVIAREIREPDSKISVTRSEETAQSGARRLAPNSFIFVPGTTNNDLVAYGNIQVWLSKSRATMQSWPTDQPISVTCPGLVRVNLMANVPLTDKTLYVQTVVRGQFKEHVIPPSYAENCFAQRSDQQRPYGDSYSTDTYTEFDEDVRPKMCASYSYPNGGQLRSYQRQISFPIDGDYGPEATVIVFFYDRNSERNDIIPVTFKLPNLNNCTSPSIALESTDLAGGLQMDRKIASPGEQVTLTVRPKGEFSHSDRYDSSESDSHVCFIRASDVALDSVGVKANLVDLANYARKIQQMTYEYRPNSPVKLAEAFQAAGLQLQTTHPDELIQPKFQRCYYLRAFSASIQNAQPLSSNTETQTTSSSPRLRDFFPEVWLYEVAPIELLDKQSHSRPIYGVTKQLSTPDSITTWKASAFCTTPNSGLWIAKPTSILVTLPFFVDLTLPKQLKRGEVLFLPISVFARDDAISQLGLNNVCFEVRLNTQIDSADWELIGNSTRVMCLCAGQKNTVTQAMSAKRLGKLNVTVEATATAGGAACGTQTSTTDTLVSADSRRSFADRIRRQILVDPEGTPQQSSVGDILCLRRNESLAVNRSFPIRLPQTIVSGSLRIYLHYSDEVLGPALANLDKLIRIPMGCGEQNMLRVSPNVYTLDYLLSVPNTQSVQRTTNLIETAKRNIVTGYRNQLRYQLSDGSFSAFGPSDRVGSTWLTSLVLRVFSAAYRIDKTLSVDWTTLFNGTTQFLSQQQNSSDGCFYERGRVINSAMQGSIGSANEADRAVLITAYVMSALLEFTNTNSSSNDTQFKHLITNSLGCITQKLEATPGGSKSLDNYALAQVAYATALTSSNLTTELINELENRKQTSSAGVFWTARVNATSESNDASLNVEATAYAYLTLAQLNRSNTELFPIIRWLASQQSTQGGFYSTQDTILGLQAIADFAKRLALSESPNATNTVRVGAEITPAAYTFSDTLTPDKRRISNQVAVPYLEPSEVSEIRWSVSADAPAAICLAVHASALYTIQKQLIAIDRAFVLDVSVSQPKPIATETPDACTRANLTVCLRPPPDLVNPIETGLLLVQVRMVSGWKPVREQIRQSVGTGLANLRQVEFDETDDTVSLYFNGFSLSELSPGQNWTVLQRCALVALQQSTYVDQPKPAVIEAQDYYATERTASTNYTLAPCGKPE